MPPRVPLPPSPIAISRPSAHSLCKSCLVRSFSSTTPVSAEERSPRQPTAHRRRFYQWLEGPGEVFRHPLPKSTNYLNAYDRAGNLLRATKHREASTSTPETADSRALDAAAEGPEIPKETAEDLRPFPMNNHFVSQSILSEELRVEIWRRVQEDGKSVRQVSAISDHHRPDLRPVRTVLRNLQSAARFRPRSPLLLWLSTRHRGRRDPVPLARSSRSPRSPAQYQSRLVWEADEEEALGEIVEQSI